MEEFRKDTSLRLEFMKEQLDFRSTDMLIRFSFSLNPEKEIGSRKYRKLQNILADIGGIFNFLLICGLILNYLNDQF